MLFINQLENTCFLSDEVRKKPTLHTNAKAPATQSCESFAYLSPNIWVTVSA